MEKYKNFVRIEQIKELMKDGKANEALEIADKVNQAKLKSISDLNVLSDIYLETGMLVKARDCLLELLQRAESRRVLMQLINLEIRLKDGKAADEYYERFHKLAPDDFYNYIFRYSIDKIEGKPYEVLIESLEKLKEVEYIDTWAYELAKLYHKSGQQERCIQECTDLEVWFGSGEFVERARALKAYYLGELDINAIREESAEEQAEISHVNTENQPEEIDEVSDGNATFQPEENDEISEDYVAGQVGEAAEDVNSVSNEYTEYTAQQAEGNHGDTEKQPEEIGEISDGNEAFKPEEIDEVSGETEESASSEQEETYDRGDGAVKATESGNDSAVKAEPDEDEKLIYDLLSEEENYLASMVKDELKSMGFDTSSEGKRTKVDAAKKPSEQKKANQKRAEQKRTEQKKSEQKRTEQKNSEQDKATQNKTELKKQCQNNRETEKDNQKNKSVKEGKKDRWGWLKNLGFGKKGAAVSGPDEETDVPVFEDDDFDVSEKTSDMQESEERENGNMNSIAGNGSVNEAVREKAVKAGGNSENEIGRETVKQAEDETGKEDEERSEADGRKDSEEQSEKPGNSDVSEEAEEEVRVVSVDVEEMLKQSTDVDQSLAELTAEAIENAGNQEDEIELGVEEPVEHEFRALAESPIAQEGHLAKFLEENNADLEDFFGFFAYQRKTRTQIIRCLEILLNPSVKNICMVVTGEKKSGKTKLIKGFTRILHLSGYLKNQKVALTDAEKLNRMKFSDKLGKLAGCCLVIDKSGRLSRESATSLMNADKVFAGQTAVILTDCRTEMNKLFRDNRELNSMFPQRIHIPDFDFDDLTDFAFVKFKENDCLLAKSAEEELKKQIRRLSRVTGEGTLAKVDDYVGRVIDRAETRVAQNYIKMSMEGKQAERDNLILLKDVIPVEEVL